MVLAGFTGRSLASLDSFGLTSAPPLAYPSFLWRAEKQVDYTSDAELLALYDTFIFELTDADEIVTPCCKAVGLVEGTPESAIDGEQPACCSYAVEHGDILFDIKPVGESNEDFVLLSVISPGKPSQSLFAKPADDACSSTSESLDTDDLKSQQISAIVNFQGYESQMLEIDTILSHDGSENSNCKHVQSQLFRPLMRSPVSLDIPTMYNKETLQSEEVSVVMDENVVVSRQFWQTKYDDILFQITGRHFLPGLDHLTDVNARSAFVQYNNDIKERS